MRLSESEILSIRNLALQHFGSDVQVILFGSRTSDQERGGDIDLFIRNANGEKPAIRTKINFITDLILQIGEQKIDVVLDYHELRKTIFYQTIIQKGIQLC